MFQQAVDLAGFRPEVPASISGLRFQHQFHFQSLCCVLQPRPTSMAPGDRPGTQGEVCLLAWFSKSHPMNEPGIHKPLCGVAFLLHHFPGIVRLPAFSEPLARKVGLSFLCALPYASHDCAQVQGELTGLHPTALGFRLERKLPRPQSSGYLWLLS